MLGLATHEPYFTILREEFKPNQPRPCEVCNQYGEHASCDCHVISIVTMVTGHTMKECTGEVRVKQGEVSTCIYSKFLFSYMYICMYVHIICVLYEL